MDISKDTIYETCMSIINDRSTMTTQELDIIYFEFSEKFRKLYETCKAEQDITSLKKELKILLSIRQEVISGFKDTISANVQVGEYMAKQHLYPIVGEPSKERKKKEIARIVKEDAEQKREMQKAAKKN